MLPIKAVCVSIHDVAPATWPACLVLWKALREVAPDLPLTWLLVPHYHGSLVTVGMSGMPEMPEISDMPDMTDMMGISQAMAQTLGGVVSAGHELALHGCTHLDDGPPPATLRERFLRRIYTTGEGEFAAIDEIDAGRRIDLGLAWFASNGWPVGGFVPPAWLLSSGARAAVRKRAFSYFTTFNKLEVLPDGPSVTSPSLVYSARQAAGRSMSPRLADMLATALAQRSLIRFSLHPADAAHPALLLHAQKLLERLLRDRQPMTKDRFAGYARMHHRAGTLQESDAVHLAAQPGKGFRDASDRWH